MKKLLLIIFASLSMTACGSLAGKATGAGNAKLKAGDTVVFKLSRGAYGEGKIETIDGSRYKIPYGTTTPTVDESDVYQLPKSGATAELKAGDLVIAKQGNQNSWVPAEVTSAEGKALAVKTIAYKQTMNLSPEQVIVARPAAIEEFKKLKTEAAFDDKVATMRPTLPTGRVPKKGDRVVAAWSGNSWWAGTIVGQSGEKMMIKWGDSSRDSEVDISRIGLFPAVGSTATPFKTGDILLVKPTTTSSIWTFAEAISDREVRFKDDTTRAVRGDEYILFN
jgi:hypothetical protein